MLPCSMFLIKPPRRTRSLISVTLPSNPKSKQMRIGFSSTLVRTLGLNTVGRMHIDVDEKKTFVTFIPARPDTEECWSFPFSPEGKQTKTAMGRVLWIRRGLLPIKPQIYTPEVDKSDAGVRITIPFAHA